jgi:hypothetical protein
MQPKGITGTDEQDEEGMPGQTGSRSRWSVPVRDELKGAATDRAGRCQSQITIIVDLGCLVCQLYNIYQPDSRADCRVFDKQLPKGYHTTYVVGRTDLNMGGAG